MICFGRASLLVEQKSSGRSLKKARDQAFDYFPGLKDSDLPRYLLLSDFQTFELHDLDEGEDFSFTLAELPENIEKFSFILGLQKRSFKDQDPVNIRAAELVGRLHDALEESGYKDHKLEQFLVRLVFCLFADDTGIFEPRDIFLDLLENRTAEDGSDPGLWLAHLFQTLNTPEKERSTSLDEDLARFPYVNGALFENPIPIPSFDSTMRHHLIEACLFDWSSISPAIFGSLFQSVMDNKARRAQGAHYTTEKNILKLIEPLFLDELRAKFNHIKTLKRERKKKLTELQRELSQLTFFDPACGCGNFLIITYRELRLLEIDILKELHKDNKQLITDASELSKIDVDQFYGIEIAEFPAKIAETALWMMDHIMNSRLSLEFGHYYARIPLKKSPHILHADALETDWEEFIPSETCSYILGNPPFIGQSYQSKAQREQMRLLTNPQGKRASPLDYVGAWFLKAGAYLHHVPPASSAPKIAFVATSSITQGEQVGLLWPRIFEDYKLEINFAHRSFSWTSEARGKAQVYVVIIGLIQQGETPEIKRLFSYETYHAEPFESTCKSITAYLGDGSKLANPHIVVKDRVKPLTDRPRMMNGPKATDGGHYIFRGEEREEFLAREPGAEKFLRPYIGAEEFLNGKQRWILDLAEAEPAELRTLPHILDRIRKVKAFRESSKKPATRKLALTPTLLEGKTMPDQDFLLIPRVSSERREYAPLAWMTPPSIPSDATTWLAQATKPVFALLTSAMHMAWMRTVAGRLKSDYRYSVGLVYNTFPFPEVTDKHLDNLTPGAEAVLAARAEHPASTLADLYDPDVMPASLRHAHKNLDQAVDKLYRKKPFQTEQERVDHLLGLYEQ